MALLLWLVAARKLSETQRGRTEGRPSALAPIDMEPDRGGPGRSNHIPLKGPRSGSMSMHGRVAGLVLTLFGLGPLWEKQSLLVLFWPIVSTRSSGSALYPFFGGGFPLLKWTTAKSWYRYSDLSTGGPSQVTSASPIEKPAGLEGAVSPTGYLKWAASPIKINLLPGLLGLLRNGFRPLKGPVDLKREIGKQTKPR